MPDDVVGFRASTTINIGGFMNNDFETAISFKALYKGLRKSRRNVIWKDSVAGYSANSLKNTYKLRKSILHGTYKLDPYQVFHIHEPKEREIIATRIKDRQLQRSLCDVVLYPEVIKHFIYDNGACQVGKGVDFSLDRMNCHLQRHFRKHGLTGWVLQCDIRHFFGETPHAVAKQALQKRVRCQASIDYASKIIDSFGGERGIGLGSQVSQITQLAVLDDLDHYIKERLRIKHYIRYMDDFVLIHENKECLVFCLKEINLKLFEIGLELNDKTVLLPLKQGLTFLKWRFFLTDTGKVIRRMNPKSITKERRKLRKLKSKVESGTLLLEDAATNFNSWKANAQRGNTYKLISNMEKYYTELFKEESK